ncbi:MAG TPA: class I SAM-dependent methyltransferase [Actinomycetota bacterium]|nr:class I SAM-dependent methyltransferase [Actinomycetota bacterium]
MDQSRLGETRRFWDAAADAFDEEPDHGMRDPRILHAWTESLRGWMPAEGSAVLEVGCGTGSVALVLAGLGHDVTGIDLSPRMLEIARTRAAVAGRVIRFDLMDAAAPDFPSGTFDVVICRHLLWTLPDPPQVLARWASLLRPAGRLVLIEGYWDTGAGLHSEEVVAALPSSVANVTVQDLTGRSKLWGREVTDERYTVVAAVHDES